MESKKADSCKIQESATSSIGFFSLSLTKGTDYIYWTLDKGSFFVEKGDCLSSSLKIYGMTGCNT